MSTRNPFDPSDLSDDQTELDVQSFTSDDDDTDASAYGSYGFDAPQYGVPPRTLQKRSHPARGSKRPTRTGVGQARTELPRTERTDLMPPSTVLHPRQHS